MKKLLIIIIAAVVGLGGGATAVAIANTPENAAARTLTSVIEDFIERDEFETIVKAFNGGSLEFSFEGAKEEGEETYRGGKLNGKAYFNKKAVMLSGLEYSFENSKVSGDVYISRDTVYVKENEILGDAYGFKMSTLADDLKSSIFAPTSGTELAMDEYTFNTVITMLDAYNNLGDFEKDTKKLLKTVAKDTWEIIADEADIDAENASVRLNKSKEDVRLITIEIDGDAMADIIADTYNYLRNSKDINEFIEKHEDTFMPVLTNLYGELEYNSLSEMYEKWFDDNEDFIDDLCREIDEDFSTITISIATPKLSATLLMLEVEVGKDTIFTLDCGKKGAKKSDSISLTTPEIEMTYEVDKNDKKKFEATFNVLPKDADSNFKGFEFSVEIDKERGDYEITSVSKEVFPDDNYSAIHTDTYTITGDYSKKGDAVTFTVDKITNAFGPQGDIDEYTIEFDIEITLDKKDKMPSPLTNFKPVSDITVDNLTTWVNGFVGE